MSRSATDATRFTATGPYAYSKPAAPAATAPSAANLRKPNVKVNSPQGSSSQTSFGSGGGGSQGGQQQQQQYQHETPKQKVERLRAEARAARIANTFSPVDRIIHRGRIWADRAHRFTVISLLAFSGEFRESYKAFIHCMYVCMCVCVWTNLERNQGLLAWSRSTASVHFYCIIDDRNTYG